MAGTTNAGTYRLLSLRAVYLYADENQVNNVQIVNSHYSPSVLSVNKSIYCSYHHIVIYNNMMYLKKNNNNKQLKIQRTKGTK